MGSRSILVSLVALALVLSACGGKSAEATPAPTQAAAATTAPTPTPAPTVASTPAPKADPDQALIDLLKSGKGSAYKVSYTFSTTTKGVTQTGSFAQAWKPPYYRVEFTTTQSGKTDTVISITRPEGTFICGALFGPSPACIAAPTSGGLTAGFAPPQPLAPKDLAGMTFVATSGKSVAGVDARCYTVAGASTAGATVVGCFSNEGVPLYVSSTGGSSGSDITMTATQYSTSVTDADFALPYPVTKAPGQP